MSVTNLWLVDTDIPIHIEEEKELHMYFTFFSCLIKKKFFISIVFSLSSQSCTCVTKSHYG